MPTATSAPLQPLRLGLLACALALGAGSPAQAAKKKARPAAAVEPAIAYAQRADAMQLAAEIAQRRGLPEDWVRAALAQARFLPQVPRLMTPPAKGFVKNWDVYRSRFVEPLRIAAGRRFWQAHGATLARAEREYGVPAEIIAGIIGVETIYGQQMGNIRVIDALATLSLDFPEAHPRAAARIAYFRGELEQFLATAHGAGGDPFAPRGSYAGAMGLGQFMPTSWAQWAVDYDGDGRIDLFNSAADAIGSVANYFVAHGWKRDLPAYFQAQVTLGDPLLPALLAPDILPSFSAAELQRGGVRLASDGDQYPGKLALIEFANGSGGEPFYLAGTENFYAITRYNWSSFYALSVLELGAAVKAAHLRENMRENQRQTAAH